MDSKRFRTLIVSLFALSIVFSSQIFAQEKKIEFTGGIGFGNSQFINYSPISAFGNVNEATNSYLFYVNFGLNFNQKAGIDLKLKLNNSNFIQTDGLWSKLEEESTFAYIGINPKIIFPITEKLDIVPFIGIGALFQGSNTNANIAQTIPIRYGMAANYGISFNYELSRKFYISATIETLTGNLEKSELPNDLEGYRNNNLKSINSYDFSLSLNIKL